jgi:glycosyltransferase involved in cell wall biosynthesis
VRSIPNGAEVAVRSGTRGDSPVVCFVGSLNYGPNIDSAGVLINKVAPLVWQQVPDARFVIAGRRPALSVLELSGPRVEVLANVPTVLDVFHAADVAVFPDEHGVGIRNSVREALAAGTPVVATPVAAREQEAHPLLTVEEDIGSLVERVVGYLAAPRTEHRGSGEAAVRSWEVVTQEYLDELRMAISHDAHDPQRRSSPA